MKYQRISHFIAPIFQYFIEMRFRIFIFLFASILISSLFSSCSNKAEQAAELICDCNARLVAYNAKMKKLTAENDAVTIAAMQDEGEEITKNAATCLKKMEETIGKKQMNSKEFEVALMPLVEKKCPRVYEAYKRANGLK